MRVVIVDDHAVVRAGLRAVLQSTPGIEAIDDFSRPEEAIDWIRAHDTDLVLMDLRFGRISEPGGTGGAEAVRRIRAMGGPPVLVVSSYGSQPEILEALAAGAAGYVLKDSSTQELLSAIEASVSGERFLDTEIRHHVEGRAGASPSLTERELTVFRLVAEGCGNAEIAKKLGVSQATIKTHLTHLYDKLGVGSRTAAVAEARALGLVEE